MANRYVLKFSKTGYAKYTSHLDMLRFFKRAFRKNGIPLRYSKGFNPHPRMGFAQPLSLGYSSVYELLDFETEEFLEPEKLMNRLAGDMPEGLQLNSCVQLSSDIKSLAALADSALYEVRIPYEKSTDADRKTLENLPAAFISQKEIKALKRQKKDKKMVLVDIKDKIRQFEIFIFNDQLILRMLLDCGSASNCSPELVISAFCDFAKMNIPRYNMEVERKKIFFSKNLQF